MDAIEVKNITKIYRKGLRGIKIPAVTDLSFSVRKERITGFVGPNGAGKTTTIKMITGLVFPTSGCVVVSGKNASDPSARAGLSYLSEQPYFYAHLNVTEMLRFVARLLRLPAGTIAAEINRVLGLVELSHKARSKVKELSKGMQQRLNMAQALLGNPHTLVLDEPMSGMDPPGRRLFREILCKLRDEKKTLFFSTHVLDDIESVCDDVIVLEQGKCAYAGAVSTLLDEGFLGTEIVTGSLSEEIREKVINAGCTIRQITTGDECVLFLEKNGDTAQILRLLAGSSVYPQLVIRRTMTLETLLYHRTAGGAS
jgi:ABC-2 type transport system ATP-binding protein